MAFLKPQQETRSYTVDKIRVAIFSCTWFGPYCPQYFVTHRTFLPNTSSTVTSTPMAALDAVPFASRNLFGGALKLSLPSTWLDTEAFMDIIRRPVPDNQEIFVAPQAPDEREDAPRPVALFVDILEAAVDECPDMSAAPLFHAGEVLKRDERPEEAAALVGDALAAPFPVELSPAFQAEAGDGLAAMAATFKSCDLEVCIVRIPRCSTDLVFSLHGRSDAGGAIACPPLVELLATFEVVDYGLFGGEDGEDGGAGEERLLGS